jgi:NADPH:quinone reductase-like Zn-dependent oxidoreductase
MAAPSQIKQWVVTDNKHEFDGLKLQDAPLPQVGDNDVLIKVHAASLNYRDLAIARVRLQAPFWPSPTRSALITGN